MNKRFRLRWTLHCAAGELLGIGAAGGIAFLVNHWIGEPATMVARFLVLAAMMLAGAIEGSLLGYFQWRVLREKFARLPLKEWAGYTIAIAVLGWFLGMLPSLFFIPSPEPGQTGAPGVDLDQPFLFAALTIGLGLFLGALFGLFQWMALRKYAANAGRWITANAIGWGLALGWIYLFASLPQADTPLWLTICSGICGGILAGLTLGAITGWWLQRIPAV